MKKTLSMGAFTELDEREVMETDGGINLVMPYPEPTPSAAADIVAQSVIWGIVGGATGGALGAVVGAIGGFCSSYVSHISSGDTKLGFTNVDVGPVTAKF